MTPTTLISIDDLRKVRAEWEAEGLTVGFVPTMGALHEGHVSLVPFAKERADKVIVSIFVNPKQFGPTEDFSSYPRTFKEDLEKLEPLGVDAVFLPNASSIYPEGFQTRVVGGDMTKGLCGASREGHFDGVLTVVLKLFNLVRPQVAVFGKKDYQQLKVIEKMALDLDLGIEILGVDTVREEDGLAMSSRNRYLDEKQRMMAACLYQGLSAAKDVFDSGERDSKKIIQACLKVIEAVSMVQIEYLELCDSTSLVPVGEKLDTSAALLLAAKIGETRLIDNIVLEL